MKLALMLPAIPDRKWALARQVGVHYAITKLHPDLTGALPPWDLDTLLLAKERFEEAGFSLYGLESDEFYMDRIKLGLPGRDEDIDKYCQMLRNLGALGVPLVCYNFMARIGWYRTSVTVPERGGARTSSFDESLVRNAPLTEVGEVSQEQMWKNYVYFASAVVPVAEEAGVKLALHPDDPPIPSLRGIGRIFGSAAAFRRAVNELVPSPNHGVAFCQATFKAMGEDIEAVAREFGAKIFFVHLRDIEGTATQFRETFHDNGPTSIPAMLKLYHEIGFSGPIRPDHTPALAGEDDGTPGYETLGRLFAVGYMKGIMETLGIPIE